ncbi:MAG: hypothetical protein AAFO94_03235 [Bacteroidota bacterium]
MIETIFSYSRCLCIIALSCFCFQPVTAQCKLLRPSQLSKISKVKYQAKLELLDHRLASAISIKEDEAKCEYRTYVRCKNYISDKEWHWAEIITLNSCDEILTYSTANREHFQTIRRGLARGAKSMGTRSYDGLFFEVFRNKRGQVIEFNQHLNEQGKLFYLVNIIRN